MRHSTVVRISNVGARRLRTAGGTISDGRSPAPAKQARHAATFDEEQYASVALAADRGSPCSGYYSHRRARNRTSVPTPLIRVGRGAVSPLPGSRNICEHLGSLGFGQVVGSKILLELGSSCARGSDACVA